MHPARWIRTFSLVLFCFCAALLRGDTAFAGESVDYSNLATELRRTEIAFAKTMSSRDVAAFTEFLSKEVVFFTGKNELHGRDAVSQAWARYFDGADAPFSWEPDAVAVLESGNLGFTSGPVLDPDGKRIGTFNSVWRRLPEGRWEIVFDRGCPPCECP